MRCQCRENFLEPSHFLVENIARLPKGRALDLAMGFGRNAIYLAKLGYAIDGVEISPEAVDGALASAEEAGLPQGLGARHRAAAGITALTDAIAIVISQSTGEVRVFSGGKIFLEIEKETSERKYKARE